MEHFIFNKLFPKQISEEIKKIIAAYRIEPEEIRIRVGQSPILRCINKEYVCSNIVITDKDVTHIMMNATNGAFHASIDSIKNGFLPLPNGGRLGICGEGSVIERKIYNIRNITSLCLRIAAEKHGCSDSFFETAYSSGFKNTIIIAPPGAGKTTLLRECIRKLSNIGYYIGVADERGEISGMHEGKSTFDLGCRTDILFGIDKPQASIMLLRTMAPDIIAVDEITSYRDLPAIIEATGCGVGLLSTIHGKNLSDLSKPSFQDILKIKAFELAIIINVVDGKRVYLMERLHV